MTAMCLPVAVQMNQMPMVSFPEEIKDFTYLLAGQLLLAHPSVAGIVPHPTLGKRPLELLIKQMVVAGCDLMREAAFLYTAMGGLAICSAGRGDLHLVTLGRTPFDDGKEVTQDDVMRVVGLAAQNENVSLSLLGGLHGVIFDDDQLSDVFTEMLRHVAKHENYASPEEAAADPVFLTSIKDGMRSSYFGKIMIVTTLVSLVTGRTLDEAAEGLGHMMGDETETPDTESGHVGAAVS